MSEMDKSADIKSSLFQEAKECKEKYADIINLPYNKSKKHPQMSIEERAAQFAPFAALTGYGEEIKEVEEIINKQN